MTERKDASKHKVLIVDDEHLIRWSLGKGLRSAGYEAIQAASGEEALSMMEEIRPDVVLLDLWMPGMNGFRVMERATRKDLKPFFIVLTGAAGIQTAFKAIKNGAVDYICKPFEIEDVTRRIQTVLEASRLMRKSGNIENKPDTGDKF